MLFQMVTATLAISTPKKSRMWREEQLVLVTTGFLERGSGTRTVEGVADGAGEEAQS